MFALGILVSQIARRETSVGIRSLVGLPTFIESRFCRSTVVRFRSDYEQFGIRLIGTEPTPGEFFEKKLRQYRRDADFQYALYERALREYSRRPDDFPPFVSKTTSASKQIELVLPSLGDHLLRTTYDATSMDLDLSQFEGNWARLVDLMGGRAFLANEMLRKAIGEGSPNVTHTFGLALQRDLDQVWWASYCEDQAANTFAGLRYLRAPQTIPYESNVLSYEHAKQVIDPGRWQRIRDGSARRLRRLAADSQVEEYYWQVTGQADTFPPGRWGWMHATVRTTRSESSLVLVNIDNSTNVDMGSDNEYSGNINFGNNVQQIIDKSSGKIDDQQIADLLADVQLTVQQLVNSIDDPAIKEALTDNLDRLSTELTRPHPDRRWWSLSIDGLKEAADNLGEIGAPLATLIGALLGALG